MYFGLNLVHGFDVGFCSYDNKDPKERGYIMIFMVDKCTGFGHN